MGAALSSDLRKWIESIVNYYGEAQPPGPAMPFVENPDSWPTSLQQVVSMVDHMNTTLVAAWSACPPTSNSGGGLVSARQKGSFRIDFGGIKEVQNAGVFWRARVKIIAQCEPPARELRLSVNQWLRLRKVGVFDAGTIFLN